MPDAAEPKVAAALWIAPRKRGSDPGIVNLAGKIGVEYFNRSLFWEKLHGNVPRWSLV